MSTDSVLGGKPRAIFRSQLIKQISLRKYHRQFPNKQAKNIHETIYSTQ